MISYITYAFYYLTRLNFSVALPAITLDLGYSKFILGLIGGAFSVSYAIGQFLNGQIVEIIGSRKLITLGLILTAILNLLFGFVEIPILMVILWAMNGYAQSTGWPSMVRIINKWFGEERRGTISGLFGSCFLVGSILAWAASGYVTGNLGWRMSFHIPALLTILLIPLFYLGVRDEPKNTHEKEGRMKENKPKLRFWCILQSRRFIIIAVAYTLLQFVRSGFTLWAPSYIFETYGLPLETASYGSTLIPLGGIAGSIIAGWLSDKFRFYKRVPIMASMSLCLTLLLITLYNASSYGFYTGIIILFLSGLTLYGPHVIMVTTIPMDYGDEYGAAGIAGFIDGIGYIGTTFADPFIGWIADTMGWGGAVTFWVISALSSSILTLLLLKRKN